MPESTIKYYPVLARILLWMDGNTVVSYRASIMTRNGPLAVDYRMVHRFVMEYKGPSESCGNNKEYCDLYRDRALGYLQKKVRKAGQFEGKTLEPTVEIEIDLRDVRPTSVVVSGT